MTIEEPTLSLREILAEDGIDVDSDGFCFDTFAKQRTEDLVAEITDDPEAQDYILENYIDSGCWEGTMQFEPEFLEEGLEELDANLIGDMEFFYENFQKETNLENNFIDSILEGE